MKVSENLMTDKQYDGLLIEFLNDLEIQLEKAISEHAVETEKCIRRTIEKTKHKLTVS